MTLEISECLSTDTFLIIRSKRVEQCFQRKRRVIWGRMVCLFLWYGQVRNQNEGWDETMLIVYNNNADVHTILIAESYYNKLKSKPDPYPLTMYQKSYSHIGWLWTHFKWEGTLYIIKTAVVPNLWRTILKLEASEMLQTVNHIDTVLNKNA